MVTLTSAQPGGAAPLMSMREIAELAGVKRPVVSTWRRRHPDFPAPAEGNEIAPLFDPRDVAEWLLATGRITPERAGVDLSFYTLAGLGAGLPARDLIAAVTALICLRHMDDDEPLATGTDDIAGDLVSRAARLDPEDELVLSETRSLGEHAARLAAAVDDLVEAAWGCRDAFERIMDARSRFKSAELYAGCLTTGLASLIAGVSGACERTRRVGSVTVADLNAGAGDILVAVARCVGEDHSPMFIASEADPFLARLLRRRLTVHGVPPTDLDVRISDELPDEAGDPDIIVTQIPYMPGEARSAGDVLDMIGDISVRLGRGCRAVVLGPADVLVGELKPYSPEERARAAFLTRGAVEAVIRLPGGMAPFRPGYETAIWILAADQETPWPGRILLADVADRELTHEVIESLVEDVITWRREGYHPSAHTRVFATQHRISEFTDPPRPLTVDRQLSSREFEAESAARVTRVAQLEAELDRIGANATARRRPVRSGVVSGERTPPPFETIGALGRAGRLIVRQGVRLKPADVVANGHHAVFGSREVLGHARLGERTVDRAVLTRYPRAQLTNPGDVIVTALPEFGAVVDQRGLAVVEYPARILRIPEPEQEQFTPRVLAALLTAGSSSARPRGAVRRAQRFEDYRVVLLSPTEVKLLDALLAGLDERRKLAETELGLLGELRDITTAGLVDGTLILAGDAA